MRKILSSVLCILLLLSMIAMPAGASESTTVTQVVSEEVEYLENGYRVTTIVTETYDLTSARDAMQSKTGTATKIISSGTQDLYSITVKGTFVYNGVYSKATASSYSYSIMLSSIWSFVSGSATYSDNIATATGTFKSTVVGNRTASVTVSCSEDGTIY